MPSRKPRAIDFDGLARRALREDRSSRDRTTRLLLARPVSAEARVIAQAKGVLSGMSAARALARAQRLSITFARPDGSRVQPGMVVLRLRGDARRILATERTILNFVMHASGVATETRRAVEGARGARRPLEVWATRKTLPGLRDLEKAAVVHGGGHPHRRDLSDAVLIKNNHLALVALPDAVARARARARPDEPVEVEVRTAAQAVTAARAGADALLLDNVSPRRAREIVQKLEQQDLRRGRWVELSGGITPGRVPLYRSVGADAVSLGGLTHSAPALPFHLILRSTPPLRRRAV